MNMKTEKIYKIGDKIENVEELESIACGVVIKGLKVIEASGNRWATRIIEKKDFDTFEDLKQIVLLTLIENDYIITKECYRKINKYLNNYREEKIKNIEIVVNDDENISNIDRYSYINYIKSENNVIENKEVKRKISIEMLELTERQKEILNIYSKFSMEKTAKILGISKGSVQKTIERIREKTKKLCYAIEY